MRINLGQLFVRHTAGITARNTYLVCGIIKTDEPLDTESTHLFTADMVTMLETRDVKSFSAGNDLDGVARSPIWKINIVK